MLNERINHDYVKPKLHLSGKNTVQHDWNIYEPQDSDPDYMSARQLAYFKAKLEMWKQSLLDEMCQRSGQLQNLEWNNDFNDRAAVEGEIGLDQRANSRCNKLIDKINEALRRIDDEKYGYCEDTGERIGIARLKARPTATLCVEAQEEHERFERSHNREAGLTGIMHVSVAEGLM